jgi:hypothetical protein
MRNNMDLHHMKKSVGLLLGIALLGCTMTFAHTIENVAKTKFEADLEIKATTDAVSIDTLSLGESQAYVFEALITDQVSTPIVLSTKARICRSSKSYFEIKPVTLKNVHDRPGWQNHTLSKI